MDLVSIIAVVGCIVNLMLAAHSQNWFAFFGWLTALWYALKNLL